MIDKTVELAMDLIARPSVTPSDEGCQALLIERLKVLDFEIYQRKAGEVDNLWAQRGIAAPLVVFAGHTDVLPPGPRERWQTDPFSPRIRDGYLYGRGAADMKSSLAAFITAIENYITRYPQHQGSIALLITSDGIARGGIARVAQWLTNEGKRIDYCIVGKPTSVKTLGNAIKNRQRGGLSGTLSVKGIQGHVAYPDRANNPIHVAAPALAELVVTRWEKRTENFAKTMFEISNIHAGTGADNVIPGKLEIEFNFRYSPAVTGAELRKRLEDVLKRHSVDYELSWHTGAKSSLTQPGMLAEVVHQAVRAEFGLEPALHAAAGTSGSWFIAPTGTETIELGPLNVTIEQTNERLPLQELSRLANVYTRLLQALLGAE